MVGHFNFKCYRVVTNISCAAAQEISRPRLVVRRARLTTLRLGPVPKNQCAGTAFCLVRPVGIVAWRTRQFFSERCVPPHTHNSQPEYWLPDKHVAPLTRHTLLEKYLPPQVLYIRTAIAVGHHEPEWSTVETTLKSGWDLSPLLSFPV